MSDRRKEIQAVLNKVFRDVFDDDEIVIFDDMTADDIDEWDSLMHVTLMVAVEDEFHIALSAEEIGNLKCVGELLDIIMRRSIEGKP